jgi:hypothetical protein
LKALSKKRGRPKKINVIREPNGRVSRKHQEPPSKLALEARARMMGVSMEAAEDPQTAEWIGKLHRRYQDWRRGAASSECQPSMSISSTQYDAIKSYRLLRNDYLKAIQAPGAVYDGGGRGLGDEDAANTWARYMTSKYDAARKAIQEAQNGSCFNLWAALDHCVIQEQQMPHMIGDLRVLANALATHFNGKRKG